MYICCVYVASVWFVGSNEKFNEQYLLVDFYNVCFCALIQDSVDTVEEMLRKQEDFEKMLAGQEEKFLQLNRETKVEERDRKLRDEQERREREMEEKRRIEELVSTFEVKKQRYFFFRTQMINKAYASVLFVSSSVAR